MAAVGSNYQVQVCCYTPTQISLNTSYWQVTAIGAGTDMSVSAMAVGFDTVFKDVYKPWMSPQATYRGVQVKWLPATLIPQAGYAAVTNDGPGTAAGLNLPTQVSGVITWRTALAGRRYRGRIYPGFPSDTWADNGGNLSVAGQTQLAIIATAYSVPVVIAGVGGVQDVTFALQVRSFLLIGPPRQYSYFPTTGWTARTRFATQRRRGQYGRQNALPY